MPTDFEAYEIKRAWESRLVALENVYAVGLGGKVQGGNPTGELAISVLVVRKLPRERIPAAQQIPSECDGVKTDVTELFVPVPQSVLEGGLAIEVQSLDQVSTGTLGCVARTADVPERQPPNVFLSCWHVLFNVNHETKQKHGREGDLVRLPSCSGCCEPIIGKVLRGEPAVDAAIATIEPGHEVRAHTYHKAITGTLDLQPRNWSNLSEKIVTSLKSVEFQVHKFGQTTGLTHGHILCVDTLIGDPVRRTYHLVVRPLGRSKVFTLPGDSGAVIYDNDWKVVGLLWGGPVTPTADDRKLTLAVPIEFVQKALQIRIATNPPMRVWRAHGEERTLPLARVHRDLLAVGYGKRILALHGRHEEEIRRLLRLSRPFVVVWHRNHGPVMVRALRDLAEERTPALPDRLGDWSWAECARRIADTLLAIGSAALREDVVRYLPLVTRLGGRSYAEVRELFDAFATLETSHRPRGAPAPLP